MQTIIVRYNKLVAIFFLILGGIGTVLASWLLLLGSFNVISIFLAGLPLLIGVLYFTRPYFIVEQHQIVVVAMLGPARRAYGFFTPADVKLENNRLFVRIGSGWRRVPASRWLADPADWNALESMIRG